MPEAEFTITGYVHEWPISSYGRRVKFEKLGVPAEYYNSEEGIGADGKFTVFVVGDQSYKVYARLVVSGTPTWVPVWAPYPVHTVGTSGTIRTCVTLTDPNA